VESPDGRTTTMDPAPGYDDRLPHDAAHLIVENELGIEGGVFRLLAARGTDVPTARNNRKAVRRGKKTARDNKEDLQFSEHAVYAAQSRWERREHLPDTKIATAELARICERFEEFARKWSELPVGGSVSVEWKPAMAKRANR
jgi:hypothetical protein